MTTTNHKPTIGFALAVAALLAWAEPATAEDCGSPCTVTSEGLPTLRLVNTVLGTPDWDLETSAFGVELADENDNPRTGAFRVEHQTGFNALVIDVFERIGINTNTPAEDLHIKSTSPQIRLEDTSLGAGLADIRMENNGVSIEGNTGLDIVQISTLAPARSLNIHPGGEVGIGNFPSSSVKFHVHGNARVEGDVALGSSRTLKTAFDAVDAAEVLTRLADLPVASWRYKTEDEAKRHIGPFAEDFRRLFGLGDGETISVIDAQGVALAAIQGLQRELAETNAQVTRRDARIVDLTQRLNKLEGTLAALVARGGDG